MKNCWLDIDKEGLRKSLGQKDKVFLLTFLLTEMVSNAWDEDITKVEVTLSRPDENNQSWLRVIDNSPTGWGDLSHSHTMFAESTKKGKSEKRGRFNAGEKDVLALAIEAKLTTVKGQVLKEGDDISIDGSTPLHLSVDPGLNPQRGSSAVLANSVRRVAAAAPGWLTVAELPPALPA